MTEGSERSDDAEPGVIVTFYSYKGGVGRSMALANVAELLLDRGLSVLMVDWDLEAPGLDRYFPGGATDAEAHDGLLDLLLDYRRRLAEPPTPDGLLPTGNLDDYILSNVGAESRLSLLSAGKRDAEHVDDYARNVQEFDWTEFYEKWAGGLYFEWFRKELCRRYDVVLIDSRTGVTEMGGVCTYHLADIIVLFCSANNQSLDGTYEMSRRFLDPELNARRAPRSLEVVVVPARIDDGVETDRVNEFKQAFIAQFNRPDEDFWELKIPYVAYYAFEELVAVREATLARAERFIPAFTRIVEKLASRAPRQSALAKASPAPRTETLGHRADRAYAQLPAAVQQHALGILGVFVKEAQQDGTRGLVAVTQGHLVDALSNVPPDELGELERAGLLERVRDRSKRDELRLPEGLTSWTKFATWIEANAAALLTRARAAAAAELWAERDRAPANLLGEGDLLTEAGALLAGNEVRLTPLQTEFVQASLARRDEPKSGASGSRRWFAVAVIGVLTIVAAVLWFVVPKTLRGEISGYPQNAKGSICSGICCAEIESGGSFEFRPRTECDGGKIAVHVDGYCDLELPSFPDSGVVDFTPRQRRISWKLVNGSGEPITGGYISHSNGQEGSVIDGNGRFDLNIPCRGGTFTVEAKQKDTSRTLEIDPDSNERTIVWNAKPCCVNSRENADLSYMCKWQPTESELGERIKIIGKATDIGKAMDCDALYVRPYDESCTAPTLCCTTSADADPSQWQKADGCSGVLLPSTSPACDRVFLRDDRACEPAKPSPCCVNKMEDAERPCGRRRTKSAEGERLKLDAPECSAIYLRPKDPECSPACIK